MTVQLPIPDFAAARRAMIENQLRPVGVTDRAVLEAMGDVPREQFVPEDNRPLAYADRSLPLGGGRFMAAPAILGQLLTQMAPQQGERALVIGAGLGYSAAVLAAMGCQVTALECSTELIARAAGRPQVDAVVGLNRDLTRSGILDTGTSKGPTLSTGVDLSYPIFNGG